MSRLAIVIPAQGNIALLESGLVSVLEHRPPQSEIWIVLDGPYCDPYGLEGEVRFLQAARSAGLAESVNVALEHCTAPVVHLLGCGVEVGDGWADRAVAHFADPRVAAVTPLAMSASDRRTPLARGVRYAAGGVSAGGGPRRFARRAACVLGPTSLAGFYRAAVLRALGGLCADVGDEWADVDLALSLRGLGMQSVCEPESAVYVPNSAPRRSGLLARGRYAERLFRRHVGHGNASPARHAVACASDGLLAPLTWLGRLSAWRERATLGRHAARLAELRETLVAPLLAAGRIDPAHGAHLASARGLLRQKSGV